MGADGLHDVQPSAGAHEVLGVGLWRPQLVLVCGGAVLQVLLALG